MSCSAIHHVEMCLQDARPTLHLFTYGLGFSVVGGRKTPTCQQWVLQQRNSIFVITQRRHAGSNITSDICCNGITQSSSDTCHTTPNMHPLNKCPKQINGYQCSSINDNSTLITQDHSRERKFVDYVVLNNENVELVNRCNGIYSPDVISEEPSAPLKEMTANCNSSSNKMTANNNNESESCHDAEEWTVFCCGGHGLPHVDSVFNAALVVRDVTAVVRRVERQGGRVIKQPRLLKDDQGEVTYAIIATPLGNVVHTLIDKRKYRGSFLPGFNMVQEETLSVAEHQSCVDNCDSNKEGVPVSTHLDHVAYVCEEGKSTEVIQWYEKIFNMKRFLVNSDEDINEGLAIEAGVGLRLKALEYWKCFETGLYHREDSQDTSLKIVIGEPITAIKDNHVSAFLECHGGPGIQHIALHSPTMLATVRAMATRGVPFRRPPPTYYTQVGKREDMEHVGLGAEAEALMAAGVLLDTEADPPNQGDQEGDGVVLQNRYLMQIFTEPIFGTKSFFMEVVHRAGAEGFGVGNITALARSIELHQHQPLALKGGMAV